MSKDLIEFYEEERNRIKKEINDLWEVGKKMLDKDKKTET